MTPTPEQAAILEAVRTTRDNLLIEARAGAAKTTTLLMIAEALPMQSIQCIAFNKRIATELQQRLPENGTAATMNSLGHRAWSKFLGKRLRLETSKTFNLFKEEQEKLSQQDKSESFKSLSFIMQSVALSKSMGFITKHPYARPLVSESDFLAALPEEPTDLEWDLILRIVKKGLEQSLQGIIDFDDQLLCSALFPAVFDTAPLTLVDEAQDLSPINHLMVKKMTRNQRLIAVGDPCQPDGTLITRVLKPANRWNKAKLEQIPIEEIKEDDTVLGYNGVGAFLYNRKVEGITRKPYSGELVSITGRGIYSRYTPNHHCYASFASLRHKYALYLMQKDELFRMGICKMDYGDMGSGPIVRAKHEGADAVWILDCYEDQKDAQMYEAFYQAKYGIPDLTFVEPSSNGERGFLSAFWSMAASLNLEHRAAQCLTEFKRDIRYPLWEQGQTYTSLKRPIVIRACNLISGCLMLPYAGKSKITTDAWEPVAVGYEDYEGFVTSFTISDNHLYVADNLVTHNCQAIYGFRGADEASMEHLARDFAMKKMFLTLTFRCPPEIVAEAQWRAPDMRSAAKHSGSVETIPHWGAASLPETAAIICRNNAPLFGCAIRLIKAGRYPELIGNDVLAGLVKVLRSLGKPETSHDKAYQKAVEWKEKALKKQRSKAAVHDRFACIELFLAQGPTLADAIAYAEHISKSKGRIKLMTAHKSKGLEFDHVFILDQHLMRDEGQDLNLRYVAQTRAQRTLSYVTTEGWCDEY